MARANCNRPRPGRPDWPIVLTKHWCPYLGRGSVKTRTPCSSAYLPLFLFAAVVFLRPRASGLAAERPDTDWRRPGPRATHRPEHQPRRGLWQPPCVCNEISSHLCPLVQTAALLPIHTSVQAMYRLSASPTDVCPIDKPSGSRSRLGCPVLSALSMEGACVDMSTAGYGRSTC